ASPSPFPAATTISAIHDPDRLVLSRPPGLDPGPRRGVAAGGPVAVEIPARRNLRLGHAGLEPLDSLGRGDAARGARPGARSAGHAARVRVESLVDVRHLGPVGGAAGPRCRTST